MILLRIALLAGLAFLLWRTWRYFKPAPSQTNEIAKPLPEAKPAARKHDDEP